MWKLDLKLDLSAEDFETPFAVSRYVYSHNMVVNPFDDGYHVNYNRPNIELWRKLFTQAFIFVLDPEGKQRAGHVIPPEQVSGSGTIRVKPEDTDVVVFTALASGGGLMPFVRWSNS